MEFKMEKINKELLENNKKGYEAKLEENKDKEYFKGFYLGAIFTINELLELKKISVSKLDTIRRFANKKLKEIRSTSGCDYDEGFNFGRSLAIEDLSEY